VLRVQEESLLAHEGQREQFRVLQSMPRYLIPQISQDGPVECLGGAMIDVQPNNWREGLLSIDTVPCDLLKSNCTGGTSVDTCGIGYVGPICRGKHCNPSLECDYDHNFARDTYEKCVQCKEYTWPWP
jgi:hypothetical protein